MVIALPVFYLVTFFFAVLAVWIQGALSRRSGNRCFHISRNKQIIRTRPPQGRTGSDYIGLVPLTGIEPVWIAPRDFKSLVSANSTTAAYVQLSHYTTLYRAAQQPILRPPALPKGQVLSINCGVMSGYLSAVMLLYARRAGVRRAACHWRVRMRVRKLRQTTMGCNRQFKEHAGI